MTTGITNSSSSHLQVDEAASSSSSVSVVNVHPSAMEANMQTTLEQPSPSQEGDVLSQGSTFSADSSMTANNIPTGVVTANVVTAEAPRDTVHGFPQLQFVTDRLRRSRKRISQFEIGLDDNRTIFMPGQRIDGYVSLRVVQPIIVRILRLRFSGTVTTRMSRKENSISSASSTTVIFKELQTVLGSAGEEERIPLEPGDYVYPFSFRVPLATLPASFEGNFGRVKYEITGILARPNSSIKTCSTILTIPSTVDAADSLYQAPTESKLHIPVGLWLWRTGYLDASLSVPKGAFSSEEIMPVTLDILNHSASGAVLRDVYMKQTRGPNTERVHRLTFTETFPAQTRHIRRIINFPIPSTTVFSPSIKTSNLEVTHTLIVKISTNQRFAKPRKLIIPITIAGFPSTLPDFGAGGRESMDTLPVYYPPLLSQDHNTSTQSSPYRRRSVATTVSRPTSGMIVVVEPLRFGDEEDVRDEPVRTRRRGLSVNSTSSYSSMYRRRQHAVDANPLEGARLLRSNSQNRSLNSVIIEESTGHLSIPTSPVGIIGTTTSVGDCIPALNPQFVETDSEGDEDSEVVEPFEESSRNSLIPATTELLRMQSLPRPAMDASTNESNPVNCDNEVLESRLEEAGGFEDIRQRRATETPRVTFSPTTFSSSSKTLEVDSSPSPDFKRSPLRNKDSAVALDTMGEDEASP
ncbi:hypothetical protein BC829DRAFT_440786 [Chytridium lagenaria]|nr:hypothetical protein BC829DRAFT_440786 [Chytridium lagenaria]